VEDLSARAGWRISTMAAAAAATVLGLWLLVGAAKASAAPTVPSAYAYSHSFADEGQLNHPNSGGSVAVEPGTGNVLVADASNTMVEVFAPGSAPSDPPLTQFAEGIFATAIAVDQDSGAIYVEDSVFGSLTRWTSDGAAVPTYTQDPSYSGEVFDRSGGIAVDPTTGDLLAIEPGAEEVVRLDSSGARVSTFPARSLSQQFGDAIRIGVGADGKVYVGDETYGNGPNRVRRFTPSGEPIGTLPVVGSAQAVGLDPVTGTVDVVSERSSGNLWLEGFDSTGERTSEVAFPALEPSTVSGGVAVDSESGELYAVTTGYGPVPGVRVFDPVPAPGTEAPTVSAITTAGAHVSAEVDPGAPTPAGSFAYFEYSGDGGKTWDSTSKQDVTAAGPVEADLTGLAPNLEYLVRTVVGDEFVSHRTTSTSFATLPIPPATVTGAATDVYETSAVINGTINPAGQQTTYHFEYGLTSAYGSRVPATIEAVAGNGRAPRIFSRTLTGLQPGTTYHYRLVAENATGISDGGDRTFTTLTPGAIPARAYEQVTPVEKLGGTIDPNVGFQAAADGSSFAYMVRSPGEAEGSPLFTRFLSRRGSTDWESGIPIDPPMNVVRSTIFTTTIGISPDGSRAFVMSNRALLPGGVENGANFYLKDLRSGKYTLVAATGAPFAFTIFTTLKAQNKFLWGNSDYSSVIFESPAPLLPGVNATAYYRWTDADGLQLESVMPDGSAPLGETGLPSTEGDPQYVSSDGKRSYFRIIGGEQDGVYLREDGQTRPISISRRAGDPNTPQAGEILAISKDGRYAFFYAILAAPLTDDAPELEGDIYRYDAVTDELEFIGGQAGPGFTPSNIAFVGIGDDGETLYFAGRDGLEVWRNGATHLIYPGTNISQGTAFVSPSGRYLAFAGYEEPIHLYDAETEELTCVSCLSDGSDPGGARLPVGEKQASNQIPAAVTDRGEVFFSSTARLVAADVNGESDAYVSEGGKARLISPGNAPFPAYFADISAGGKDVFFTTAQKLVGRDDDKSVDVYDARIGGGLPEQSPPPPQECLRDDCKAIPNAAPEPRLGGSEALSGPGNVKPKKHAHHCPKGKRAVKRKGKTRCVKTHAKRANHNRRQAR
jgi:hypothetical protein